MLSGEAGEHMKRQVWHDVWLERHLDGHAIQVAEQQQGGAERREGEAEAEAIR